MTQRLRNIRFTCNNWTQSDYDKIKGMKYKYLVMGKEIAPTTGTPHLQGYMYLENARTLNSIRKEMKGCDVRKSDFPEECITYCKKDNNFEEWGEAPKQGKRTDIDANVASILNGEVTAEDILIENPMMYHQYGRTLEKAEEIMLMKRVRELIMPECIWLHGPTGTGKSHMAFENFDYKTHYVWKNDNGWQDNYRGQETIIINEFRGEIKYSELLEMTDKWPNTFRRRNRPPMPNMARKIIVTSSLTPDKIYTNLHKEDKLEQLYRRFVFIEMTQKYTGGNNDAPVSCP